MKLIHRILSSGKWQKMSLSQQLANIGSEVNRVIYWQKKGDKVNQEKAAYRALELIDLTIADKRWKFRLWEIIRLREIFCDLFLGKNIYNIQPKSLQDYFFFFALDASKDKL